MKNTAITSLLSLALIAFAVACGGTQQEGTAEPGVESAIETMEHADKLKVTSPADLAG